VPANLIVASLGDVPCAPNQGTGTLRQAIVDATWDALVGGDPSSTITFLPGMVGIIRLQTPLPALLTDITIQGSGATVTNGSGQGMPYIFFIDSDTCEIDNLTITNPGGTGIGIAAGTGVTLYSCTIANCTADPLVTNGGGIWNEGTLFMDLCTVQGNSAASGGGIWNDGTLNCYQCTISDKQTSPVGFGGGICTTDIGNSVRLVDSNVVFNSAADGGGISNNGGTLTVIGPMEDGGPMD